ncbi:serine protease, subtilase family [Legionella gratiana]|uniref:Serine protease, subtilase family n=1 Tax=Legionella gratiana TaxID=45066 RepID=A0A378J2N3_9GAMM|nr:S53 family peptidase [Legionella gratiana]KTD14499.1 serine protease, subtilase family [Legionella gratiana]STX42002.1 serine protease, subtilase family [Legionella gratiana]
MLPLKSLSLALLPFCLMLANSYAGKSNMLVSLPSPGSSLIEHATFVKPVEAHKKLKFIVWLKLRNKAQLDKLVEEIYDPHSPNYQRYLTHDVFEEHYAPTKEIEDALQKYFTAQGMQADIVNHSVQVTASVHQIENTLHTSLNYYFYDQGMIYANASKPSLPSEIAQYIVDITGLNNIPLYHPNNMFTQMNASSYEQEFIGDVLIPKAIPTTTSIHGFSGEQLQYTYNINNIPPVSGTHLDGKGQTLIIVDGCGENSPEQILSDANQYFSANGIKPFFTSGASRNFAMLNQNLTPYTTVCTPTSPGQYGFTGEIALDVESSHTLAPENNTVLIVTDGNNQAAALQSVISYLVANYFTIAGFSNAYVISNSWTSPESASVDPNTSMEQSLQTAAAFGISVQFSSGDCGDNTYTSPRKGADGKIKCKNKGDAKAVNYPASSPYVTAVGATSIFVDNNYNYAFENVWGTYDVKKAGFVSGTTGGISQFYQAPIWQSSINTFYAGGYGHISAPAHAKCGVMGSQPCRAVPDVSMLGDPSTGLNMVINGSYIQNGGTSLACPLFSATILLVNQGRTLLNKPRIGHTAPYLYQMNSILRSKRALNLIVPPAKVIDGATAPDPSTYPKAPSTAFVLPNKQGDEDIWGWDSALTIAPESQFWNDAIGVGSPNLPNFVPLMANL